MLKTHQVATADRRRYRGIKDAARLRLDVGWSEAGSIAVPAGSVVSITAVDGSAVAWLTALAADERVFSTDARDLPGAVTHALDPTAFDSRAMAAIATARDGDLHQARAVSIFDRTAEAGEIFVARMRVDATLHVIAPVANGFIEGGGGGRFSVQVRLPQNASADFLLPDPPGKVCNEWRVGRGTARAYELKKGQFVQIMDVEGQQCSDFMAMRAGWMSASRGISIRPYPGR